MHIFSFAGGYSLISSRPATNPSDSHCPAIDRIVNLRLYANSCGEELKISGGIDNLIAWWDEAGVDTIVADEPRSWLEAASLPANSAVRAGEAPTTANALQHTDMPDDIGEFRKWLLSTDSLTTTVNERIDSIGDPASGLMILVDMPDPDDRETGELLSGTAGQLFDRMLAAIGRDRASAYVAPLSPARLAGGAIGDAEQERLARIARHHIALAAPKQLLTMGDAPSRVFCGPSLNESRGKQHIFNHDGGTVPVIATFHPRFLLRQPRLKAQSWKDLQMMIEGLNA